jgi:hypothetical protein
MRHRCYQCKCLEDESPAKYFKRMKRSTPYFFCKACLKLNPDLVSIEKPPLKKKEKIEISSEEIRKQQVENGRRIRKMMQGRINEI